MSELGDAALTAAGLGWRVFPLKPRGKEPINKGGFHRATSDRDRVHSLWLKHPDANIGLWPGPSGLIVFDLDGPKGELLADELGLTAISTRVALTGRPDGGRHLYFTYDGETKIGNHKLGDGAIDVRAHAGYVVMPPSIHPSGRPYRWDGEIEVAPVPAKALEALNATVTNASLTGVKRITKGGRNSHLASYAGKLRRSGATPEEILAALLVRNEQQCDPPLPKREVERVAASIGRYAAGDEATYASDDEAIDAFNARYGIIQSGGKGYVLEERGTSFELLRPRELEFLTLTETVIHNGKKVPAAKVWLTDRRRRHFHGGLVFEPDPEQRTPDSFNLWRDWAVEPREGNAHWRFLEHIRANVCNGSREHYEWVIGWFAHIFQNPTRKLDTALVLIGEQGAGKSIVGEHIGYLLGPHYLAPANSRYITGHFNRHLENLLLLQAEEAFWAGDHNAVGVLKNLITNNKHLIERKGVDPISLPNYVRLLVTSNERWVVPAGWDERRFCVIEVSSRRKKDQDYFGAIDRSMEEEGGYATLLHHLLTYPYDESRLRNVLETRALAEQKVHSLASEEQWWADVLNNGILPGDREGRGEARASTIYRHYQEYARRSGARRTLSETAFGFFLKRVLAREDGDRGKREEWFADYKTGEKRRAWIRIFPLLRVCRERFTEATRSAIEWEGISEEWGVDETDYEAWGDPSPFA